jgi:hypothetical protein
MLIFVLALATTPLTETQQRDIGCVALLGLLADEQRRGAQDISFPDVTAKGRTYAGIVGARIVAETGLPREVVAQAIIAAAESGRARALESLAGKNEGIGQLNQCLPLMEADLAANAPLPKPVTSK